MINYIKSELYKSRHNRSFRNFVIVLLVLSVGFVCLLSCFSNTSSNRYCNTEFALSNLYDGVGVFIFITLLMQTKIELSEEKSNPIRYSVNYGISRFTIYAGKQIVGILISSLVYVIICSLYIGISYLLLEHSNVGELEITIRALIAGLSIFIATYALGQMFLLNIKSSTISIFLSMVLIIGISIITRIIGVKILFFKELNNWCLYSLFEKKEMIINGETVYNYVWYNNIGIIKCYIVSTVWFVLSNLIGIAWFNKKEIM